MTVAELIEELKKEDQSLPVMMWDDVQDQYYDVTAVSVTSYYLKEEKKWMDLLTFWLR